MGNVQRLYLDDVKKGAKVGVWDIEAMGLNAGFGYMLVNGLAPLHARKAEEVQILRIDEYHKDTREYWNDSRMVKDTVRQLRQYDYIVSYNGVWYDAAFVVTRAIRTGIKWGLEEKKHVDLFQMNRQRFRVNNRSLNALLIHLNCRKQKTALRPLTWAKAGCGNQKAIDEIVVHNIHDVLSLAEAARKILKTGSLPWRYIR